VAQAILSVCGRSGRYTVSPEHNFKPRGNGALALVGPGGKSRRAHPAAKRQANCAQRISELFLLETTPCSPSFISDSPLPNPQLADPR